MQGKAAKKAAEEEKFQFPRAGKMQGHTPSKLIIFYMFSPNLSSCFGVLLTKNLKIVRSVRAAPAPHANESTLAQKRAHSLPKKQKKRVRVSTFFRAGGWKNRTIEKRQEPPTVAARNSSEPRKSRCGEGSCGFFSRTKSPILWHNYMEAEAVYRYKGAEKR